MKRKISFFAICIFVFLFSIVKVMALNTTDVVVFDKTIGFDNPGGYINLWTAFGIDNVYWQAELI